MNPPIARLNPARILLNCACFVIVVAGMRAASTVLVPFLLAVFISVIATPLFIALRKAGLRAGFALIIIVLALVVVSVLTGQVALRSLNEFSKNIPTYQTQLQSQQTKLVNWLKDKGAVGRGTPNLFEEDLRDLDTLASQLRQSRAEVPEFLRSQFSEATLQLLAAVPADAAGQQELKAALLLELNRIIQGPAIYEPERFAGVRLSPETQQLLGADPTGRAVARLNRLLLADAFPRELSRDLKEDRELKQFKEYLDNILNPGVAMRYAANLAATVSALLGNGLLILLIVLFILLEVALLPEKIRRLPGLSEELWDRLREMTDNVRHYMGMKTIMSLLTGLLVGVWLLTLRIDYPLLLGMTAFVLNFIPVVGSIIAAVPGVFLALVHFGPGYALLCAFGYVVINVGISNFLEPRYMGRGLGLSPLIILLSVFFWGWVLGPVGMLLSVPITMAAKIGLESEPQTVWLALLLGPPSVRNRGKPEGASQPAQPAQADSTAEKTSPTAERSSPTLSHDRKSGATSN